jgi:hypothetical protein
MGLLWIVVFPWYLVVRSEIKAGVIPKLAGPVRSESALKVVLWIGGIVVVIIALVSAALFMSASKSVDKLWQRASSQLAEGAKQPAVADSSLTTSSGASAQSASTPTGAAEGIRLQVPDFRPFKGKMPCEDANQESAGNRIDQTPTLVQSEQALLGDQWKDFTQYLDETTCTVDGIQQYGDFLELKEFQAHVGPNVALELLDTEHNQLYVFWVKPFLDSGHAGVGVLFASSPPTAEVLKRVTDEFADNEFWTMAETSRSTQNGVTVVTFSFSEKPKPPGN